MYNINDNTQLVIPASFEECFTYEQQVLCLQEEIKNLMEIIADLTARVVTLESKGE